jgi:hypothetical protein
MSRHSSNYYTLNKYADQLLSIQKSNLFSSRSNTVVACLSVFIKLPRTQQDTLLNEVFAKNELSAQAKEYHSIRLPEDVYDDVILMTSKYSQSQAMIISAVLHLYLSKRLSFSI